MFPKKLERGILMQGTYQSDSETSLEANADECVVRNMVVVV